MVNTQMEVVLAQRTQYVPHAQRSKIPLMGQNLHAQLLKTLAAVHAKLVRPKLKRQTLLTRALYVLPVRWASTENEVQAALCVQHAPR